MKVFLLSDLVVHELASMQLEGKWLSSENFVESAQLWFSRYAPEHQLSKENLAALEREVIQIATRVAADEKAACDDSPLACLFLDIPTVNYAHPLSVLALSASLEACRNAVLGIGDAVKTDGASPLRRRVVVSAGMSSSGLPARPSIGQRAGNGVNARLTRVALGQDSNAAASSDSRSSAATGSIDADAV